MPTTLPAVVKSTKPQLTLSRRFELCFGRKLGADLDERTGLEQYGPVAAAVHGSGVNATVRVRINGQLDSQTGMVANLVDIKGRIGDVLNSRYDHKMLNLDTPPFDSEPPTLELIAQQMLSDTQSVTTDQPYTVDEIEYQESDKQGAVARKNRIERIEWFSLSAARETISPQLSPTENERLFGIATRLHGHGYRIGLTLSGDVSARYGVIASHAAIRRVITDIEDEFDHRSLNELRAFRGRPTTTETFSRILFDLISSNLPIEGLTVQENDWFSVTSDSAGTILTLRDSFQAMHRLHRPQFSLSENQLLYGTCNHPHGHGHEYQVAVTIQGPYSEKSGTIAHLSDLQDTIGRVLARYRHRYLDLECEEFVNRPSSGEVIASVLWERFDEALGPSLVEVVLDETPNNRFVVARPAN